MSKTEILPQASDRSNSFLQDLEKTASNDKIMSNNVPLQRPEQDILASQSTDPALDAKMQIINDVRIPNPSSADFCS